jgi:hypothetical protein
MRQRKRREKERKKIYQPLLTTKNTKEKILQLGSFGKFSQTHAII